MKQEVSPRQYVHRIAIQAFGYAAHALFAERNVAKEPWPADDAELAELMDAERFEFEQAMAMGDVEGAKRELADILLFGAMRIHEAEGRERRS